MTSNYFKKVVMNCLFLFKREDSKNVHQGVH
jgi:hypothetical protein